MPYTTHGDEQTPEHPLQPMIDAVNKLADFIRDVMEEFEDLFIDLREIKKRADHRDRSLKGTAPPRVDHRHVAHTHTRPDHLAGPPIHRRRTP